MTPYEWGDDDDMEWHVLRGSLEGSFIAFDFQRMELKRAVTRMFIVSRIMK